MYRKTVVLLAMAFGLSFGQISNGSFESWTNGNPDNWTQVLFSTLNPSVTKSQTAEDSAASLRGTVIYDSTMAFVYAPLIMSESPISQRYAALTGYYQFTPVGDDEIYITIILKKAGSLMSTAVGNLAITNTATSWTHMSIPITYISSTDVPDSCIMTIQIKSATKSQSAHPGSTMLIDNLSLSMSAGILPDRAPSRLTKGVSKDGPSIKFNLSTPFKFNSASNVFNPQGKITHGSSRSGSGMIIFYKQKCSFSY